MLNYVLEGVRAGLVLSVLVGPLLVLLLQLSIRRGTVMALAAAAGIWLSDLSFVLLTHYGMGSVEALTEHPYFAEIVGTVGMALLVGMGILLWFKPPVRLELADRPVRRRRGLLAALVQGFAVNTFNPFTVGFWAFFTVTQIHERDLGAGPAWAVFAGILGTIVLTDTLKVLGARKLRELLRPDIILRVQRFGALALGLFGVVLGLRVWF